MTSNPSSLDETDKGLMRIDFRQMARDTREILRTFDKWALGVAIIALIVMLVAGVTWYLALVLTPAVYAGFTLARPHPPLVPAEPPPPPTTEEEQAFANASAATANIMAQAKLIPNAPIRRQVRAVGAKFAKMLDVMEEDHRYNSAPDYYNLLVHGFEQQLTAYVRMIERKVNLAVAQLEHFEQNIVPRTLSVAESFYQDYHLSDVIDLASLIELHKLNLDNIDGTDDEQDDEEDENSVAPNPDSTPRSGDGHAASSGQSETRESR